MRFRLDMEANQVRSSGVIIKRRVKLGIALSRSCASSVWAVIEKKRIAEVDCRPFAGNWRREGTFAERSIRVAPQARSFIPYCGGMREIFWPANFSAMSKAFSAARRSGMVGRIEAAIRNTFPG